MIKLDKGNAFLFIWCIVLLWKRQVFCGIEELLAKWDFLTKDFGFSGKESQKHSFNKILIGCLGSK